MVLDLSDFDLQEQPENNCNLMVAISQAWHDG